MKEAKRLIVLVLLLFITTTCSTKNEPPLQETSWIKFVLTDACDDGYSPDITYYDMTDGVSTWGPYYLQVYGEPLYQTLDCNVGDKICVGAWMNDTFWGCGQECAEGCDNCCGFCNGQVLEYTLTCQ